VRSPVRIWAPRFSLFFAPPRTPVLRGFLMEIGYRRIASVMSSPTIVSDSRSPHPPGARGCRTPGSSGHSGFPGMSPALPTRSETSTFARQGPRRAARDIGCTEPGASLDACRILTPTMRGQEPKHGSGRAPERAKPVMSRSGCHGFPVAATRPLHPHRGSLRGSHGRPHHAIPQRGRSLWINLSRYESDEYGSSPPSTSPVSSATAGVRVRCLTPGRAYTWSGA
jgi:hypothetical protein